MGTRASHHIFTLDKQTGRILWDRAVAIGKTPQWNSAAIPLIYRNRIYEGSPLAPVVTCLDAASGRILWQRKTDAVVKGGMVALDGVVYFGDMGGYLWAVNASDGRTIGRLRENLQFRVGSPIIVNRSLIVGSREGTVVALPLRDIRDAQAPLPP
jgi:outer membrane protein assembly factor BamB